MTLNKTHKKLQANRWIGKLEASFPICARVRVQAHAHTYTATHSNTQQHTATHSNTLQHTATHCNTLQCSTFHCNTLQHTETHCNALQHRGKFDETLAYLDTVFAQQGPFDGYAYSLTLVLFFIYQNCWHICVTIITTDVFAYPQLQYLRINTFFSLYLSLHV